MMRYLFIGLLLLFCIPFAWADPNSSFEEGLRLYRDGDMTGAIRIWQGVLDQGRASGQLLYNLGNAYYREGNVGRSVLMFERAMRLLPRDRDVRMNLDLARMATVDRVERPVRLAVWDWIDAVRDFLSARELSRLLETMGFLLLAALLAWRLGPLSIRHGLKTLAVILAALYVISASWYAWRAQIAAHPRSVIMATKTDAFSAPDSSAKQLFSLHEGTTVRTGDKLSGWVSIRLADGRVGWIPVGDLERI